MVELAAALAGVPIAILSRVGQDRQLVTAGYGIGIRELSPSLTALCAQTCLNPEPQLVVEDVTRDPRFIPELIAGDSNRVTFYAGFPIRMDAHGPPVAVLSLIDHHPRTLAPDILRRLKLLVRQTGALLKARNCECHVHPERVTRDDLYQALFNAMDDGVVLQDADTKIRSWNPAAERILGMSGGQLCGRTSLDPAWNAIRQDGTPFPGSEHPSMVALRTGNAVRGVIMGVRTGVGEPRWISINAVPLGRKQGMAPGVVCSFADITTIMQVKLELRSSQAELQMIIDHMPAMVGYWGADLRNRFANTAYISWFGFQPGEIHGRHIREVIGEERYQLNLPYIQGVLGGKSQEFERTIITPDGRIRHSLARYEPSVIDGAVVGFFALVTDVTPMREAQQLAVRAQQAAEQDNRAKSEFLATMSHELRTPLTGIIGMSEILLDSELTDQQRDITTTVRDSGLGLMGILNDILDYSRIESGRMELELRPFLLSKTAQEVLAVLIPQAQAKGLKLQLVEDVPGLIAQGDAGRCRQVLFNLVGNALKFTAAGSVVVRIASHGQECWVSVIDTGIGIAPEDQDRLFKRFSQVDGSSTRRFGGTGLGLAISQNLAHAMGGTILLASEPGRGSTFTFTLPMASGPVPQVVG